MTKLEELVSFLRKPFYDANDTKSHWAEEGKKAFVEYLGSSERYSSKAYDETGKKLIAIRNPGTDIKDGIPYIGLIQPEANTSGSYGGTSLVLFPSAKGGSLLTFCVGTDGLNPDVEVLSRPGHARRLKAIADYLNNYLNKTHSSANVRVAWAKKDPCAIEQNIPDEFLNSVLESPDGEDYERAIGKHSPYNPLLYFIVNTNALTSDVVLTEALVMLMDIMMELRGVGVLAAGTKKKDPLAKDTLIGKYLPFLFPNLTKKTVFDRLKERRFVIIQGPPGTGKTHMVVGENGLCKDYEGRMRSIQFHPNMTYESFIGGLFPIEDTSSMGFKFKPKPGILMECVKAANKLPDGENYLLHIDEINRADLSRVLGESIMLFEPTAEREIHLDQNYGSDFGDTLKMPKNLHVIGTMNTADKSVAPIDIAIRRRFAFVDLYPQISVVEAVSKENAGNELAYKAFVSLLNVFIDYAGEESFKYLPGHSYFLTKDDAEFKTRMKTEIIPLLKEYLEEGLVSSMATQIEDYIQQYRNFCV